MYASTGRTGCWRKRAGLVPALPVPITSGPMTSKAICEGVRGSDRVKDFDKSGICLRPVLVEAFCGFVFYNLDPQAESLSTQTEGLESEIRSFVPEPENLRQAHQRDYPLKANWKNSVENYSECYHCPNQHRSLSEGAIDLGSYTIKTHGGYHSHQCRGQGRWPGI